MEIIRLKWKRGDVRKGIQNKVLRVCTIVALILIIGTAGTVMAASSGNGSPTLQWSLDAQLMVVSGKGMAKQGARATTQKRIDTLRNKLNAKGITVRTGAAGISDEGVACNFKASGSGDVDTFRSIIHSTVKPEFDMLGGVTEMEIDAPAFESTNLTLVMEANPSTGYRWRVASGSAMVEESPSEYEKHTLGYGKTERQIIRLVPVGSGPVKLMYSRSWESAPVTGSLKLNVSSLPARLDLSDPAAPAGKVTVPAGKVQNSAFPVIRQDLPASFDWRDNDGANIVTEIRDQGSCGSCWAFGTVAIMESALGKQGVSGTDLSEQFLVSCNEDSWSCNGGLTAHKYHYDTLGKNQSTIGAVYETDKPYTATDGSCSTNYNKAYSLSKWQFITGSEWSVPTNEQIKSAIYTYGPVTAAVCAGNGWDSYSGGVFSTDESSYCSGSGNHQIVLVGWNDDEEYWILRNSWGTGWGDNGYMYIKYGISLVGEGTSWVVADTGSDDDDDDEDDTTTNYTLSVSVSGPGSVTSSPAGINCGSTCSADFASGTTVTLTAAPSSERYSFRGWSGGCSGTGTCVLTMDAAKTVSARFARAPRFPVFPFFGH